MQLSPSFLLLFIFILAEAGPIHRNDGFGHQYGQPGDIYKDIQDELIRFYEKEYNVPKLARPADERATVKSQKIVIEDDNGDYVEVDLDEDDDESEETTLLDLHNRVEFSLYTRENDGFPELLYVGNEAALERTTFDPTKETRFIVHGWINSKRSAACTLPRDAYLKHGDYNVIVVDWSRITMRPYLWATRRVKMVGKYVGLMIDFLHKHGTSLNTMTLVGHSLGAHVVGLAGYYAAGTVNYIAGLDPALPMFMFSGPGSRISKDSAKHVEIIHTNAGLLGFSDAIGHADFYPNGGKRQVGCFVDPGGACSHARSYQFFAESINTPIGFYGTECKGYMQFKLGWCKKNGKTAMMGGPKDDFAPPGTYYLKTKARSPYAKGI